MPTPFLPPSHNDIVSSTKKPVSSIEDILVTACRTQVTTTCRVPCHLSALSWGWVRLPAAAFAGGQGAAEDLTITPTLLNAPTSPAGGHG